MIRLAFLKLFFLILLCGSTYTKIKLFCILLAPTVSKPKVKTFFGGWFFTIDKSFP
ncbi:hypothetical protein HMPREF1404_01591 [Helicobacter pylori GAM210Bi]|nr:hypothetical protein HMPREF1404_01591 [Helicobacter pylori GAM210Bi]